MGRKKITQYRRHQRPVYKLAYHAVFIWTGSLAMCISSSSFCRLPRRQRSYAH